MVYAKQFGLKTLGYADLTPQSAPALAQPP